MIGNPSWEKESSLPNTRQKVGVSFSLCDFTSNYLLDIEEFITLAKVEQEEYKTAAILAATEKDKKAVADIYYYWGRCIKDLCRDKTGNARYQLLLAEEDKYKTAFTLEPTDSYILYSWAINLRFQLEFLEGEEAVEMYR